MSRANQLWATTLDAEFCRLGYVPTCMTSNISGSSSISSITVENAGRVNRSTRAPRILGGPQDNALVFFVYSACGRASPLLFSVTPVRL